MSIRILVCWIKGFWHTLNNTVAFNGWVSGHDYTEIFRDREKQVLQCDFCETESTAYFASKYKRVEGL